MEVVPQVLVDLSALWQCEGESPVPPPAVVQELIEVISHDFHIWVIPFMF